MLLAMCVALLSLTGCFKEEKQGTCMLIQLWSQNVAKDPVLPITSDVEGYAFEVKKGSKWEVSSWEDSPRIQGCIAVQAGQIRLIDNVKIK